jgi:hypothetical protein
MERVMGIDKSVGNGFGRTPFSAPAGPPPGTAADSPRHLRPAVQGRSVIGELDRRKRIWSG